MENIDYEKLAIETDAVIEKIKPLLDELFANKSDEDKLDIYDILSDSIWIDYDIKMPENCGNKS
jgi:hypothetical protein